MKEISQLEIANLTSLDRETVRRRLEGMVFTPGPKRAKLYRSDSALIRVLGVGDGSDDGVERVTQAEATRRYTISRDEQVKLEMEVTRGDRWPKDDVEEIHETSLSNVAGLLKGHEGKVLTPELIRDIFTELREVPAKLAKL